jgi:hypothetical protein
MHLGASRRCLLEVHVFSALGGNRGVTWPCRRVSRKYQPHGLRAVRERFRCASKLPCAYVGSAARCRVLRRFIRRSFGHHEGASPRLAKRRCASRLFKEAHLGRPPPCRFGIPKRLGTFVPPRQRAKSRRQLSRDSAAWQACFGLHALARTSCFLMPARLVGEGGEGGEAAAGLHVVYLGISGVLHPSRSLYELVEGRNPWDAGHRPYEAVPVLEHILQGWPACRVVLTSTQPWSKGLPTVLECLGPALAQRVVGFTFEDLTTKLRLGRRQKPLSEEDYWRLPKSEIVRLHAGWLAPTAWVAIDDETIAWTEHEAVHQLVAVDGCKGLLDPTAQALLRSLLTEAFGSPSSS